MDSFWHCWNELGLLLKGNMLLVIEVNSLYVILAFYATKRGSSMFHWLGRHFFIIYWIDIEMSNLSKIIIERYGYVGLVAVALIPTPPFRELALFMGISSGLEHTLSIVVAINALLVYLSIIVIF